MKEPRQLKVMEFMFLASYTRERDCTIRRLEGSVLRICSRDALIANK